MSDLHRTRRPATGLALAAVLGLGTSFGLMAAPVSAEPGNGQGQAGAPAQAAGGTATGTAPQASADPGKSEGNGNGNPGKSGGNGNPGKSEGNGGKSGGNGNPGKSEGNGNPGKSEGNGNPGKSEGNGGKSGGNGNPGKSGGNGNPGKSEGNNGNGPKGNNGNPGKSEGNNGNGPKGNNAGGNGGGPTTAPGSTNDETGGPAEGDPAGNNGTIKITPVGEDDGIPQNSPHPGCSFQVEWYGFDANVASTVSVEVQAPTDGTVSIVEGTNPFPLDGDGASGAGTDTGLDGTEVYTLAFTGTPHPQQGYHVKVTVSTPFSNGNDTKSKVFWVAPCETTPPLLPGGEIETEIVPGPVPVPTPQANVLGEEASAENVVAAEQAPSADVLGEQAAAAVRVNKVLGTPGSRAAEVLPTVINAGVAGKDAVKDMSATQSALALLMLLLAAASARLAWIRRAGA